MGTPRFNSFEDVKRVLHNGGDAWYYQMVEEYMDMIAGDLSVEEFDIDELNGWIENELNSLQKGYEDYADIY